MRPSPVSTAALILGGVALTVALMPVLGLVAVPIGLVAILLGVLAILLERSRGRAATGAVLGAVAIPLSLVMTFATAGALYQTSPEDVRAEVAMVHEPLGRDETSGGTAWTRRSRPEARPRSRPVGWAMTGLSPMGL